MSDFWLKVNDTELKYSDEEKNCLLWHDGPVCGWAESNDGDYFYYMLDEEKNDISYMNTWFIAKRDIIEKNDIHNFDSFAEFVFKLNLYLKYNSNDGIYIVEQKYYHSYYEAKEIENEEFTTFKFNETRHPKEFLEFLEKNKKDFVKF